MQRPFCIGEDRKAVLYYHTAVCAQKGLAFGTAEGGFFSPELHKLVLFMDLCATVGAQEVTGTAEETETNKKQNESRKTENYTKPGEQFRGQGAQDHEDDACTHQNGSGREAVGFFHGDTSLCTL